MSDKNNQAPKNNNQIITKIPMTKTWKIIFLFCRLVIWTLGNWNLFDVWYLVIGI